MNILVLENDPREFELIQQTLGGKKYTLMPVSTSEQAWQALRADTSRFLIANWDTSDLDSTQFLTRIRASTLPGPVYILLTTSRNLEDSNALQGMDDVIQLPFKPLELKNRVAIAERILSLTAKLAQAREQLESQAVFDSLTEFMGRTAFMRQAAGELERSRRSSLPLSLIALDIDNFKLINDKYGSKTGDAVLRVVAKAIREKSRPYDCIGRWAGDEFVLALPGVIGVDAEKVAGRIIAGVRGTRVEVPNEAPLNVKVSAGIAAISRISTSTDEVEPIIQQARHAVARAKEAGGNQVFLVYL
ncbi:MAG: diguanylate cyclase [Anaerolineales bacterium]|nr:diguanylate cyclase [Anaerolineales bacterium]